MASRLYRYLMLATHGLLVPGCSIYPALPAEPMVVDNHTAPAFESYIDPSLDHFIARLPHDLAATPTEARAMTHVAIGGARARGGSEQCGSTWLVSGPTSGSTGPYLVATAGGQVWYYRIGYMPGLAGCGDTSRESLYRALQQALPDWISLRRAADSWPDKGIRPVQKAAR